MFRIVKVRSSIFPILLGFRIICNTEFSHLAEILREIGIDWEINGKPPNIPNSEFERTCLRLGL
ncbi:hypothetical protein CH366_13490 [Leptospira harrisiae]|uniref:Uncharacterized protein n=1 Tax=Leptospira harrisiae TaxID=2023189 RepID=A0A2N0AFS2_9LEPT|nr:hypothetical protein CH364_17440 [Leptospira harrisiae]PKA07415.1 hypothetical protein CH366_13490 [Leptospira harrisiae]